MDNNQLLIDAARAAGYEHRTKYNPDLHWIKNPDGTWVTWQPLIHDADAFRLMVDCGIDVDFDDDAGASFATSRVTDAVRMTLWADHNNDKHAATRMAIVRAAAQSQEKGREK